MEYPNKDLYLIDRDVALIWKSISFEPTDKNMATKEFIIKKEKLNRDFILANIKQKEFLALIRDLEDKYRNKFHNEIHHGNYLFDKFYTILNDKYSHLIRKK